MSACSDKRICTRSLSVSMLHWRIDFMFVCVAYAGKIEEIIDVTFRRSGAKYIGTWSTPAC